jgi:beta-N-acetylhexosaminidase
LENRRVVVLSRRRLLALLAVVLLAGVAVVIAVRAVGKDGPLRSTAKVPPGGSAFGSDPAGGGRVPLAALAPFLSGRTSAAAGPAAKHAPVEGVPTRLLAQLFLVGFRGTSVDDPFVGRLTRRRWGAVIVDGSNFSDPTQMTALTGRLTTAVAGGPAPLVVAEQGGGDDSRLRDLPPAPQRTIVSRGQAQATARRASGQLRRLGIRMTLAPNADLGYSGGAWDGRAYSDDPAKVNGLVTAAISGWRAGGVAPAVGHFPGEGGASQDPGDGPASVGSSLGDLRSADLRAFRGALATAPALVLSNALYAAYDGVTPATLLPQVSALARRSGFAGVVVSGNLAATVLATGGSIAQVAVQALKAGCDLLWIPGDAADQEAAYRAVVRAVRSGDIPAARVRQALADVATLKRRYARRATLGRGGTSSG